MKELTVTFTTSLNGIEKSSGGFIMFYAIEDKIKERQIALKVGDLSTAESIRAELLRFNISIIDTKNGTMWKIGNE